MPFPACALQYLIKPSLLFIERQALFCILPLSGNFRNFFWSQCLIRYNSASDFRSLATPVSATLASPGRLSAEDHKPEIFQTVQQFFSLARQKMFPVFLFRLGSSLKGSSEFLFKNFQQYRVTRLPVFSRGFIRMLVLWFLKWTFLVFALGQVFLDKLINCSQ